MLDEYALIPDIFDPAAYTNGVLSDAYLPFLKEPLFNEAIVRDLYNGEWSQHCLKNTGNLHRLTKEILRKLCQNNRLRKFPAQNTNMPSNAQEWCTESLMSHAIEPLTGIIAAHATKLSFNQDEIASIEKLTGTNWWQYRSPSVTVDRKTISFLEELDRVFKQANSLMFIDPNLDPSSNNYREFFKLLVPMSQRQLRPLIEIHRSFCQGDGPCRTFPNEREWKINFSMLGALLQSHGMSAEV